MYLYVLIKHEKYLYAWRDNEKARKDSPYLPWLSFEDPLNKNESWLEWLGKEWSLYEGSWREEVERWEEDG